MTKRVFFFAGIEATHHQHVAGDSRFAQHYALIGGGDSEPCCPSLLQRYGALFYAMSISIALNDRADDDIPADMILQNVKVGAESRKRDLSPVGTSLNARVSGDHSQESIIQVR